MDRKTKKWLKQLESPEAKERYEAVKALGLTGDTELIDELDRVANLDENVKVRTLASKAVKTLETLRKREIDRQRAAIAAADGDDPGLEWKELAQEKILRHREAAVEEKDDWTYSGSKEAQIKRAQERAEQKKLEEEAKRKAMLRRRRPFRILVILTLVLAVLALVAAVLNRLNDIDEPANQQEALRELQQWVQSQQGVLVSYQDAFATDPLDCARLTAIAPPEKSEWLASLDQNVPAGQTWGAWISSQETLLEGQAGVLDQLNGIQTTLVNLNANSIAVCEGKETIAKADWKVAYPDDEGSQIRGLRLANDTAATLETALTVTPTPEPSATPGEQ